LHSMDEDQRLNTVRLVQRPGQTARVLNPRKPHNSAPWWLRNAGKRGAIGRSALTRAVHRPAGRRRGRWSIRLWVISCTFW